MRDGATDYEDRPCCGSFSTCTRACTPRGEYQAKERFARALTEACKPLPPEYSAIVDKEFWNLLEGHPPSARSERAVPDGWKLVPVDPTGDMIDAGGKTPKMKILDSYCSTAQLRGAFTEQGLAGPKSDCAIAQSYKAMLAAAPAFTRSATATHPIAAGDLATQRALAERGPSFVNMRIAYKGFSYGMGSEDGISSLRRAIEKNGDY